MNTEQPNQSNIDQPKQAISDEELEKAIDAANKTLDLASAIDGRFAYIEDVHLNNLTTTAKRVSEVEKELADIPIGDGNGYYTLSERVKLAIIQRNYFISQTDKSRIEVNDLQSKLTTAERNLALMCSEVEGAYVGLMFHPSDVPLNGCLISNASKEKLSVLKEIIKRYGKL